MHIQVNGRPSARKQLWKLKVAVPARESPGFVIREQTPRCASARLGFGGDHRTIIVLCFLTTQRVKFNRLCSMRTEHISIFRWSELGHRSVAARSDASIISIIIVVVVPAAAVVVVAAPRRAAAPLPCLLLIIL